MIRVYKEHMTKHESHLSNIYLNARLTNMLTNISIDWDNINSLADYL